MDGASKALVAASVAMFVFIFLASPAYGARYYKQQQDMTETFVPHASYRWDQDNIHSCIYKEKEVRYAYYLWTRLAVAEWKKALNEYTNTTAWSLTVERIRSEGEMDKRCDVRIYIYNTYKDFAGYPDQTSAYTSVKYARGIAEGASIYLSPRVMHGDGEGEIDLPSHAFRNSALHEVGHMIGLAHNVKEEGYIMSPRFDFVINEDRLSITTLELSTVEEIYGSDGFG